MPKGEASIHQEGDRLVNEPVRKPSLSAVLAMLQPLAEDFPDVDAGLLPLRDLEL
jgi:antitoxin VapB